MPPPDLPVGSEFLGTPAPGCRGPGKDTALSGRELRPLLGVRVPMLGGGGPWVCDQGLRFSATHPTPQLCHRSGGLRGSRMRYV